MIVIILGACGGHAATGDATAACGPTTVYLDRNGGAYDHGDVDDATANLSVLLAGPMTLPPIAYDDTDWATLTGCIHDALAPFAITLTEIDPGTAPHLELVFTTAYWGTGGAAVPTVVPASCSAGNQIEFAFGDATLDPTNACEAAMGAFAEMTALLSPGDDCLDFTSPAVDCGIRFFLDRQMQCVDASNQPTACRCGGGTTEDTFTTLGARFPSCAD